MMGVCAAARRTAPPIIRIVAIETVRFAMVNSLLIALWVGAVRHKMDQGYAVPFGCQMSSVGMSNVKLSLTKRPGYSIHLGKSGQWGFWSGSI
jgi:hypothetical protein